MIRILEAARAGGRPALDRGETKFQVCGCLVYSSRSYLITIWVVGGYPQRGRRETHLVRSEGFFANGGKFLAYTILAASDAQTHSGSCAR